MDEIKPGFLKKVVNFVLVRKPETENKWWHRLFQVFLLGSGGILFILTLLACIGIHNNNWTTKHLSGFSLEQNYNELPGKELLCETTLDFSSSDSSKLIGTIPHIVKCPDFDISRADSLRYGTLYDTAQEDLYIKFGLEKYRNTCPTERTPDGRLSAETMTCMKRTLDEEDADPAYIQYQDALKALSRIKVTQDTDYQAVSSDIVFWVVVPVIVLVLWILFWSGLIYRLVLYIIFGKTRK